MCLLIISWQEFPTSPLIFASNRDEFHQRKTLPLHYWHDASDILAGRDMKAFGTWAGVSRTGRFAALTNIRHPQASRIGTQSRGQLVSEFLDSTVAPETYIKHLQNKAESFGGFNLLVGDKTQLGYVNNLSKECRLLQPGRYGLSNAILDTPWPKLESAKEYLEQWLTQSADKKTIETLAGILNNRMKAPDAQLPDTGVSAEWEKLLSSQFIVSEQYGTRASTGWLVDQHGRLTVKELSFDAKGTQIGSVEQQIQEFW